MDNQKLNQELKNARIADKETNETMYYHQLESAMDNIEKIRKRRLKDAPHIYTQKNVAEKAGINLSTYKSYLHDYNPNIRLITLLKIADVLRCSLNDILNYDSTKG